MIKSLYGKFVFFTIGAMFISFLLAYLAVNTYYHQYVKVQNDAKNLRIAGAIADYIEVNQTFDLEGFLETQAEAGYKLYVVDGAGVGHFYGEPFRKENLSKRAIEDVLAGDQYHGMRDLPKETFVTGFFSDESANSVGVPFSYQGEPYALFLRPNIKLLFNEIHYLLAGLLVLMAVISVMFMLYVARELVKPISQLTAATKRVGKEQFAIDLPKDRHDEIGQLARSFAKMTTQLEESDQMRKQFINDVSHDFQTPLQNIKGYAALLEDTSIERGDRQKYASIIQTETARLSTLTKQLLFLTSLDSLDALDKTQIRLDKQLKHVLQNYRWQMEEKNIALSAEMTEITLPGHEGFLEKIWENLLSNAIKYTKDGGAVNVRLAMEENSIVVTFQDTGIGIAKEYIPHLFDRFYRVDEARHAGISGTGLGLAIVAQVVRLHDGEIDVESVPKEGTTFTVRLPR
jgi:signal transduction histidine kinase